MRWRTTLSRAWSSVAEGFTLAWRALARGHVLALLLAAVALAHVLLPALVRSDGTAAGAREMYIRAVTGATYLITALTTLACACGFFAQERARKRLALTVVRPASTWGVACGTWLALCALAAAAFALTAACTALRFPETPACWHRAVPTLPPAEETARGMLADYLADPRTPEAVKKAPRATVLRLLTNKERERYDAVRTGETATWPVPAALARETNVVVRVRFATPFDMRAPLVGAFTLGPLSGTISNQTQSIVSVPLAPSTKYQAPSTKHQALSATHQAPGTSLLSFVNHGEHPLMMRPRRDIELLVPADAFAGNLARACAQMLTVTALLAAFGLFLSSALSRPVALFTALAVVAVALMAPSVVLQFPDELGTTFGNRACLALTRAIYGLTETACAAQPISDLATDMCIEPLAVLRGAAVNGLLLPLILLALAARLVRRNV